MFLVQQILIPTKTDSMANSSQTFVGRDFAVMTMMTKVLQTLLQLDGSRRTRLAVASLRANFSSDAVASTSSI